MRLTSKTYTDAGLLPITEAVSKLPSFTDLSVNDSQSSVRTSQTLSVPVEKITSRNKLRIADNKGLMSLLSTSVTTRQERGEWCAIQGLNL